MKKIILGKLVKAAAIVLVLMSIMVYILQSAFSAFSANKTAQVRLADAVTSLQHGKEQVAVLTEQLNEDYIAKANSFAEMITINPKILDDQDELSRINDLLGVDELHVTDERGVIRWGTIPEYFGFDFNTSEQTKPFIPILDDRSLEMAQEPQLNGAEGKLFQYISVGRHDARGIVQVGLEPDRLTQALAESQPDVLLGQLTVGTNGTMFAVSKADGLLAAYHDEAKLNTPAEEIGITEDILKLEAGSMKKFKIDGESCFVAITENDEYYIGAMIPASEVNGQTLTLTLIIVFMAAAVISLLIILVSHAVNANIIDVITRIDVTMKRIADGEYDLRINENSCEEFTALSSGINDMLESIESKADETSELNHSMENLLSRVADISETINGFSTEMQNVSRKIADGSTSQAATVEELSAAFSNITNDVNENAAAASNANSMTEKSAAQLRISAEKMNQMQDSMMRITESSRKINNIVKTIDDIAFQTNILALNAAVEAARAGQHGKGFAVVADEVRTLANKSAEAAKNTTELIEETLRAIDNGTIIVNEAANELTEAISGINDSTKLIAEISVATSMQAHAINEAANGINQISQVIQVNSEISHNANGTAESLSTEADKLNSLVHSH